MVGNTLSSWRAAFALLVVCQLVVSDPDVKIYTSSVKNLPNQKESEQPSKDAKTDKVSLIESSVKPDGPTKEPPINPMILPKNRQHLRFQHQDSYLTALEYSHMMAQKELAAANSQKPIRREYTPGPIYQRDNANDKKDGHNKIDVQGKISRISTYNQGSSTYQQQPSVVISEPQNYETYDSYSPPSFGQAQSFNSYSPPSHSYGPPTSSSYDSPSNSYGPPPGAYGPPSNTYGSPHHNYGSPPPSQGLGSLQATYSTSYPLPDLFPLSLMPAVDLTWPISLKLNAFTLIKIVLKIIVFKMIVKFIATICLLLFLPKIIHAEKPGNSSSNNNDDDDDSRKFTDKPSFERLRMLKSMVTKAVEHYESLNNKKGKKTKEEKEEKEEGIKRSEEPCTTLGCKIRRKLFSNDTWDDYVRLFKSYVAEEQESLNQSRNTQTKLER